MNYFKQLKQFIGTYRIGSLDTLKLALLYPVFKFHFWFYYGQNKSKAIAGIAFKLLPKRSFLTIHLYMPALDAFLPIPIWLQPDRLSTFREVFWGHAYTLKSHWTPTLLVDAGANVGYVSLYIAGHSQVKTILAIEANPEFSNALNWTASTLERHGIEMRIGMGAVVGKARLLTFQVMENNRDSHVANPAHQAEGGPIQNGFSVRGQSMRDWLRECGLADEALQKNVLLKLDVEGSEYEMLEEEPALLDTFDYLTMEVHGGSDRRDKLVDQVSRLHRILERQSNPAYSEVEMLFSEHRRLSVT